MCAVITTQEYSFVSLFHSPEFYWHGLVWPVLELDLSGTTEHLLFYFWVNQFTASSCWILSQRYDTAAICVAVPPLGGAGKPSSGGSHTQAFLWTFSWVYIPKDVLTALGKDHVWHWLSKGRTTWHFPAGVSFFLAISSWLGNDTVIVSSGPGDASTLLLTVGSSLPAVNIYLQIAFLTSISATGLQWVQLS